MTAQVQVYTVDVPAYCSHADIMERYLRPECGSLPVSEWLTALPNLKDLRLIAVGCTITKACSQLTNLALLTYEDWGPFCVVIEEGALVGLKSLILQDSVTALAPAIVAASQLKNLCIFNPASPAVDARGLECLPGLTGLTLESCELRAPPEGLSCLMALKVLDVSGNYELGSAVMAAWEPLRGLSRLTALNLAYCNLEQLPPAVAELPSLRVRLRKSQGGSGV